MRNFIIMVSVLLYVLSGIIIYRASGIPVTIGYDMSRPEAADTQGRSTAAEDISTQLAREKARNEELVKELQAKIAKLEDKLADDDKKENRGRIVAVIGSGAFRSGQVSISEDFVNTVKGIVADINASPDDRVVIEGHTDNMPIKPSAGKRFIDNRELSMLRAEAVASILVESGIASERISVVGYGDTRPIDSNATALGRINNRRVEVRLVPRDRER